jgi:hypothetical protein
MSNTSQEYDKVIAICRELFTKKAHDYGTAWRVLRLPSLTDQIFIKAQRIRSLQENERNKNMSKHDDIVQSLEERLLDKDFYENISKFVRI